MRLTKKGDSTIIAVVLLTVIVVGLGALLFTFFRAQVMNAQEKTSSKIEQAMCGTDLTISLETVNNTKGVISGNTIRFYVTAGPDNKIDGLLFTEIGDTVESVPVSKTIDKAQTQAVDANFTSIAGLTQVKIVPISIKNGKELICTDSAIIVTADQIA